jgi:hypothetical protein
MFDVLNPYRLGQKGFLKDGIVTLRPTISNEIRRRVAGHPPGLVTPEGVGKPAFNLFVRHGTMLPDGIPTRRDHARGPPSPNAGLMRMHEKAQTVPSTTRRLMALLQE